MCNALAANSDDEDGLPSPSHFIASTVKQRRYSLYLPAFCVFFIVMPAASISHGVKQWSGVCLFCLCTQK